MHEVAESMIRAGVEQIGTSQIEHVVNCKRVGIDVPFVMIRVPGYSEIADVVRFFDFSLQSELKTVISMNAECIKQNKEHGVIMMIDLGDLREGYWDTTEFVRDCLFVEDSLSNIELTGIGVNLGCYGAIKPTTEKMNELIVIARTVEQKIGHALKVVSGGATTSYPLVHSGIMPSGINHLRIGDNILLSRGLQTNWKIHDMDYLDMTAFVLRAEVVEVKTKPSYPQGEFAFNAYGKKPDYHDIGIRKRALIAMGESDVGDVSGLIPLENGVFIVGGSSDYIILDITEAERIIQVGDLVDFYPRYMNLLHSSASYKIRKTIL